MGTEWVWQEPCLCASALLSCFCISLGWQKSPSSPLLGWKLTGSYSKGSRRGSCAPWWLRQVRPFNTILGFVFRLGCTQAQRSFCLSVRLFAGNPSIKVHDRWGGCPTHPSPLTRLLLGELLIQGKGGLLLLNEHSVDHNHLCGRTDSLWQGDIKDTGKSKLGKRRP